MSKSRSSLSTSGYRGRGSAQPSPTRRDKESERRCTGAEWIWNPEASAVGRSYDESLQLAKVREVTEYKWRGSIQSQCRIHRGLSPPPTWGHMWSSTASCRWLRSWIDRRRCNDHHYHHHGHHHSTTYEDRTHNIFNVSASSASSTASSALITHFSPSSTTTTNNGGRAGSQPSGLHNVKQQSFNSTLPVINSTMRYDPPSPYPSTPSLFHHELTLSPFYPAHTHLTRHILTSIPFPFPLQIMPSLL